MKRLVTCAAIILYAIKTHPADLKAYRDTPLFNSIVQENRLPYGVYYLVRSYRNITQLVVSADSKIILYTDRDNRRDSEIFATSYSRLEEVILNVPSMQQHEFNLAVAKLIKYGDSNPLSTIQFPGAERFMEESIRSLRPEKNEGEYFIYLKENSRPVSLLTVNITWKKLTLRNILNEDKVPSTFYSIYIDECYDRNIVKLIREYSSVIKKSISQ